MYKILAPIAILMFPLAVSGCGKADTNTTAPVAENVANNETEANTTTTAEPVAAQPAAQAVTGDPDIYGSAPPPETSEGAPIGSGPPPKAEKTTGDGPDGN
jgi:hypothetical protein